MLTVGGGRNVDAVFVDKILAQRIEDEAKPKQVASKRKLATNTPLLIGNEVLAGTFGFEKTKHHGEYGRSSPTHPDVSCPVEFQLKSFRIDNWFSCEIYEWNLVAAILPDGSFTKMDLRSASGASYIFKGTISEAVAYKTSSIQSPWKAVLRLTDSNEKAEEKARKLAKAKAVAEKQRQAGLARKKAETKKTHASSSDKETSSLEKLINICTELGFAKGTEKHGDCVMKLYK